MIQYLVEMTVYDPATAGTKVLYYSTHGYASIPPGALLFQFDDGAFVQFDDGTFVEIAQYYIPRIAQPGNYEINMFASGKTSGSSQLGFGEVRLINVDGGLDHLLDYGFDGRSILFKQVTKTNDVIVLASCSMEQAEFTSKEIIIRIKDPQMAFNAPLQPVKYAGSNSLPNGIEGTDDIKGKPKPLTFGKVYNIAPVPVNTSKLIYQVHTSTVAIPAVYDKAVQLVRGTDYASQADMEANQPDPANFRAWPDGGCFRLGSQPVGQLTCDAAEGALASDRTVAQVGKRIATRAIPADTVNADDVSAVDLACSAEVGIYISDETTVIDALDQVFGSAGTWHGFDVDRIFRMQQLATPAGQPDLTLTEKHCLILDRVTSNDSGRGIPPHKVNLRYQRNYTVQTSDLGKLKHTAVDSYWDISEISYASPVTCMAYGNGFFVGISLAQTVVISPDGVDWTPVTLETSASLYGVAYGNGRFVIVGSSNASFASTDGVTWEPGTLPTQGSGVWSMVCAGNGIYLAVPNGTTSVVATSPDGILWTEQETPVPGNWSSIAFGHNMFVMTSYGSQNIVLTKDGSTWAQALAPTFLKSFATAFGNGIFVSADYEDNLVLTSSDGITWESHPLPTQELGLSGTWTNISFGDGLFMLTGGATNAWAMISSDGYAWEKVVYPGFIISLCFGDNRFIGMESAGGWMETYILGPSLVARERVPNRYRHGCSRKGKAPAVAGAERRQLDGCRGRCSSRSGPAACSIQDPPGRAEGPGKDPGGRQGDPGASSENSEPEIRVLRGQAIPGDRGGRQLGYRNRNTHAMGMI